MEKMTLEAADGLAILEERIVARIAGILGSRPTSFLRVANGYSAAGRWIVSTDSDFRAFVKIGTTPLTSRWLRAEVNIYRNLKANFMPELVGWEDDVVHPIMLLEDLSRGTWPPPWNKERIAATIDLLQKYRPEGRATTSL